MKEFRRLVAAIAAEDAWHAQMPDYSLILNESDLVVFRNRGTMNETAHKENETLELKLAAATYDQARSIAPGWDIYHLEQEWRGWITEPPRDHYAAFIGFCKKWFEREGFPR